MFAKFVQSSGGVQVAVLSSFRGQQPTALLVLPAFEFGDNQRREYILIACLRCFCLRIFALSDLISKHKIKGNLLFPSTVNIMLNLSILKVNFMASLA